MKTYCPNCKSKKEYKPKGFENYNRRWECLNCHEDIPEPKKHGWILFSLIVVGALILMINGVLAVECGAVPVDGCDITASTTFNTDTYLNNGSATQAIEIKSSNVILDCNDSTFIGNWSNAGNNGYSAIIVSNVDNITIKNCNFQRYGRALKLDDTNGTMTNLNFTDDRMGIWLDDEGLSWGGSIIDNSTFYNNTYAAIWFYASGQGDLEISNNEFYSLDHRVIYEEATISNAQNITIRNNDFWQLEGDNNLIRQINGEYWDIDGNNLYGSGLLSSYSILVQGNDTVVQNNYINGSNFGISLSNSCNNITVINNTVEFGDSGMVIKCNNVRVYNNSLRNMTNGNMDDYYVNMRADGHSNLDIRWNNFTEISTVAILLQGTTNVSIIDNWFQMISINDRSLYDADGDGYEPQCMVQATKRYKGYNADFGNINLTIAGNDWGDYNPCYLHAENLTTLNYDFQDYWHWKFTPNMTWVGDVEFWIPNSVNSLLRWTVSQNIRRDMRLANGGADANQYIEYHLNKTVAIYKNINATESFTVSPENLTSGKATFDNGTWITLGDQANLTLSAGQWVEVQQDCTVPTNEVVYSATTTLCTGTYSLDGGDSGYAIRVSGNNLVIDGQGATIYGNRSTFGLYGTSRVNVTIRNITLGNYTRGVFFSTVTNSTFTEITIANASDLGILLRNSINSTIANSTVWGDGGNMNGLFFDTSGNDNWVVGNRINSTKQAITVSRALNTTVEGNIIYGGDPQNSEIVTSQGGNGTIIFNNSVYNAGWNAINIDSYWNIISFNTIDNATHHGIDFVASPSGIDATGGYNWIYNNTITNSNNSAIYIATSYNNLVYNNYIENVTSTVSDDSGIVSEGGRNASFGNLIYNNTIINVGEALFDASLSSVWSGNIIQDVRIADVELSRSSRDATFIANGTFLADNTYSNTTLVRIAISNSNVSADFYMADGYNTYFFNNTYAGSGSSEVKLRDLTNALIIYSNNSIAGSANLADNDGNINITLAPNNWSYVYDNYNFTQGVIKTGDPVAVTSSSTAGRKTSTTITNSLDTAINTTVVIDFAPTVQCSDIRTVSPTSYKCDETSKTLSFPAQQLNSGSNLFTITYSTATGLSNFCSAFTGGIPQFFSGVIVVFAILAIAIVIVVLFLVVNAVQGKEINIAEVEGLFRQFDIRAVMVALLVIAVIAYVIIAAFASLCSI